MNDQPKKILLVEDNEDDFVLLDRIIARSGAHDFELNRVQDLQSAINYISDSPVDVVVLDMSLPDGQGIDNVTKIKAKRPTLPIVILTGLQDNGELALETLRRGAQDYLIKGKISYESFAKSIQYALERVRLENFKDDIINNISHEMRTPLTIIRECISQMNDGIFGDINEKQGAYLEKSLKNIDRLRSIIDNLLDISKIDAGKLAIYKENVNIIELIQDVVSNFQPQVKKKGLTLKLTTNDEEIHVLADKDKIFQVLTNLVGNAYKFTKEGFIEVSVTENKNSIKCCVADSGRGIAMEDRARVFERFDQLGRISGPGEKGTGLGLAITKGIIELHDGEIHLDSEEDKGTQFSFTLPKYSVDGAKFEDVIKYLKDSMRKFNYFSILVISVTDYYELSKEVGSTVLEEAVHTLEDLAKQCLHRDTDQIIRKEGTIYLILPDTEMESALVVMNRIKQVFSGNKWRKQLREKISVSYNCINYPNDGLTVDDLLSKLEQKKIDN